MERNMLDNGLILTIEINKSYIIEIKKDRLQEPKIFFV